MYMDVPGSDELHYRDEPDMRFGTNNHPLFSLIAAVFLDMTFKGIQVGIITAMDFFSDKLVAWMQGDAKPAANDL